MAATSGVGALVLSGVSMAIEGTKLLASGGDGVLGWIASAYWVGCHSLPVPSPLVMHACFHEGGQREKWRGSGAGTH